MSNDPVVLDAILGQTVRVPRKQLRLLHTAWGTWTTDLEWKKNNPDHATDDRPVGYMCDHCHEPVISALKFDPEFSGDSDDLKVDPDNLTALNGKMIFVSPKVLQGREMCGCSMLLMDRTTVPWWSEMDCPELWNTFVQAAKNAHSYGLEQFKQIRKLPEL